MPNSSKIKEEATQIHFGDEAFIGDHLGGVSGGVDSTLHHCL